MICKTQCWEVQCTPSSDGIAGEMVWGWGAPPPVEGRATGRGRASDRFLLRQTRGAGPPSWGGWRRRPRPPPPAELLTAGRLLGPAARHATKIGSHADSETSRHISPRNVVDTGAGSQSAVLMPHSANRALKRLQEHCNEQGGHRESGNWHAYLLQHKPWSRAPDRIGASHCTRQRRDTIGSVRPGAPAAVAAATDRGEEEPESREGTCWVLRRRMATAAPVRLETAFSTWPRTPNAGASTDAAAASRGTRLWYC